MKMLQAAMGGEAEKAGFSSDDDVVEMLREMCNEEQEKCGFS